MKYKITRFSSLSPGWIEIDEAEYNCIKKAKANLFETLFLEEKLDFVTENFYEYENELLSIASRMMVFHNLDYFSMSSERELISRRILNLLSAGKMYLDQSVQHIKRIYGEDSDTYELVIQEKSIQYDQYLGYRVMVALRNYVQHRGFPIHNIKFPHERVETDSVQIRHRVIPIIRISELADDKKFKKKVLKELQKIQIRDQVDAKPLIREYVMGIGKVQEKIRILMADDIRNWEEILEEVVSKYQHEFADNGSIAGLAIMKENSDRKIEEKEYIFKEFIDRQKKLQTKNSLFNNLSIRFASSEVLDNDAK